MEYTNKHFVNHLKKYGLQSYEDQDILNMYWCGPNDMNSYLIRGLSVTYNLDSRNIYLSLEEHELPLD